MTTMRRGIAWLLLLVAPGAAAQASHPCASEAQPASRLACYDRAFPLPPEVEQAATEQARAEFGLPRSREALRNPGQTEGQGDPDRVESRLVALDQSAGQRSFRLENGQVWMQADTRGGGHVRPGEVVHVRKAIMGGYQLVMPNGISVRVRRTR